MQKRRFMENFVDYRNIEFAPMYLFTENRVHLFEHFISLRILIVVLVDYHRTVACHLCHHIGRIALINHSGNEAGTGGVPCQLILYSE